MGDRTKKMSKEANTDLSVMSSNSPHKSNTGLDKLDLDKVVSLEDLLEEPEITPLGYGVFDKILPRGIGSTSSKILTDMINNMATGMDRVMGTYFRDNCIGWIDVVKGSKYSAQQYIDAVKYVTFRMSGDSQIRAYTKTFPDRISRMERDGISNSYLNSYVSAFNNSKLVADIYAQALAPTHIMYRDFFHNAILVQSEIMNNDKVSPKVRSDAANSLLTHLKAPEARKNELAITFEDNDAISQLKEAMVGLAQVQVQNIQNGNSKVIDISEAVIIKDSSEN